MARFLTLFAVFVVVVASICACTGGTNPDDEEALIFAAASLVDVLEEIGDAFNDATGMQVDFSFAGSNLIANQIVAGAGADAVIVAGSTPIETLSRSGKGDASAMRTLWSNRLAATARIGGPLAGSRDIVLQAADRIAMPDPDTAPAGEYWQNVLEEDGSWEATRSKLALTLDARAALAAATTGNADLALVYETDALTADNVEVVFTVDSDFDITAPRYYGMTLSDNGVASSFLDYIESPDATSILRRHGFTP